MSSPWNLKNIIKSQLKVLSTINSTTGNYCLVAQFHLNGYNLGFQQHLHSIYYIANRSKPRAWTNVDSQLWSVFYFLFVDQGRKKRNHIQMQYYLCSHSDEQQLEDCLIKLGGFYFRQKCTYKTAHCQYIVDCKHKDPPTGMSGGYDRTYICDKVVHNVNVRDICCQAICWPDKTLKLTVSQFFCCLFFMLF